MPAPSAAVLLELLEETRRLSRVVQQQRSRLSGETTAGMWSLLLHLSQHGAATVPEIAAARGVSRQHTQGLVDALLGRGWAMLQDNPRHRRSPRVALSAAGAAHLQALQAQEAAWAQHLCGGLEAMPTAWARDTLAALRAALEAP